MNRQVIFGGRKRRRTLSTPVAMTLYVLAGIAAFVIVVAIALGIIFGVAWVLDERLGP